MQEAPTRLEVEELQENLRVVQELLAHEKPLARQYLVELRGGLDALHAADIAYVLEALPLEERLVVWDLVKADRDGEILLEVSDAVRETLIASMDSEELVAAAETLEADELADIAADLPASVIEEVVQSLPAEERERLRAALSYPEGSVGALMDFDHVAVRDDVTLEAVTRYLRRMDELPDHTDQLFVVDREQALKGTLPLARLTVDAVVDSIRQKSAESQLAEAGLRHEEDVFAPVLDSFKNRWAWLAINLVTAFIASRVIGAFEESIARLVALAALMPIVAGIGGNSGNQTITMIVRALALGQIQGTYWAKLLAKEIGVALLNGVVWGTLLGAIAYAFYGNVALAGVMALAMLLNLVLAATMGVAIPWVRARFGRDPAVGSSVLITACTDSGGSLPKRARTQGIATP